MKEIILSKNQVALVDDEDYDELSKYKWSAMKIKRSSRIVYYAIRNIKIDKGQKMILMHRDLLNTTGRNTVDHIDCNGLNNTRSNLRSATKQQQGANRVKAANTSSRFKGVRWHKGAGKWLAQIKFNGKIRHLGCFTDEKDAAKAYDKAAIELFGEYAKPNF